MTYSTAGAPPHPLWRRVLLFWLPNNVAGRFVTLFTLLFILIFMSAGTIALTGIPHTEFRGWIWHEKEQVFRTLNRMTDLEENRLKNAINMLRTDAMELAHSPFLSSDLNQILTPPYPPPTPAIRKNLKNIHAIYDFAKIIRVISIPEGIIRLSSFPTEEGRPFKGSEVLTGVLETHSDYVGDAILAGNTPIIQVAHLLESNPNAPMGVLILDVPLVKVYTMLPGTGGGPWNTQETLLINARGELLTHIHASTPWTTMELGDDGHLPTIEPSILTKANAGDGLVETRIGRGTPVLAAYRHIRQFPGWNWVLTVQVNRDEAFSSINWAVRYATVFGIGSILLFAIASFYLTRHLTQPLRQLTRVAERLMAGDRRVRTHIRRLDEVGVLASSFDAMLETVQENLETLEQRVAERTHDLSQELGIRRLTEQHLRESETRLRQAIVESPFPSILHAEDGEVLLMSRMWTELSGYSRQEIPTTRQWVDLMFPAELREQVWNTIQSTYATQERKTHGENPIVTRSGETRIWEFHSAPLGRLADQRQLVKCMAQDVTERRRAMNDLACSERMLAEAQAIAHMGNWEWDLTTQRLRWSDEIYRIFDQDPTRWDPSYDNFLQTIHPEDRSMVQAAVEHALAGPEPFAVSHRILRPDGTERYVHEMGQVIRDENGAPLRIIGTVQDQTEQHRIMQHQRELERRLQHSQKMEAIGTLAGGIAHDFNNILSGILGYVELALMDLPNHTEPRAHVEEIFRATLRARDLVSQMLAFSRRSDATSQPINLTPLVKESIKFLRATLPSSIELQLSTPAEPLVVVADPTQMHQILLNLCTNAAHAMGQRKGRLEVLLEPVVLETSPMADGLAPGNYVHLLVKDNGCGIPPERMHRIFDPFFTTKPVGEGSGLGLSVVHGIVTGHHGAIMAESQPGEGTSFHCYLPRSNLEETPALPHTTEIPSRNTPNTDARRILLVDDQPSVLIVLERMLTALGHQVTAISSPLQAQKAFQESPDQFDLLFTDHGMPGLSGLELGLALKKIRPDLTMILCTGHADAPLEQEYRHKGFHQLVFKPVTLREVKEIMQALPRPTLDVEAPSPT